ncbi:MAG: opacity protein-like surface antigen [Cognaticolwellia sp.]|jgi:opacity protein-like surface antigen
MLPLLALLSSPDAYAKDLRGHFAIGFENQLSGMPALSAKYAFPTSQSQLNAQLQVVAGWSVDSAADNRSFFGARGLYGVVAEDNLSLLVGAGVGYVQNGEDAALRIEPLMSAEFFLFGLENLGLTLQWGLQLDLSSESTALRSMGSGAAIGAHYWF